MYDFHYNYIRQKYNYRAKLLFTDTNSLCYEIETGDAYKDFWVDKEKFDNSDFAKDCPYFCIIAKFKDEATGMPIVEFVGLRSKKYSYVKDNGKNENTCKGIRNYYMAESVFAMRLVNLRSLTCYTDQNFKENGHFGALNLFTSEKKG